MESSKDRAYVFVISLIRQGKLTFGQQINLLALSEMSGLGPESMAAAFERLTKEKWTTHFGKLGYFIGRHEAPPKVPTARRHLRNPEVLRITNLLVEDIKKGTLAPGEQLVQARIAFRYETSRATAAKAIRQLVELGVAVDRGRSRAATVKAP